MIFVPLVDELVGPGDELEVVDVVELSTDISIINGFTCMFVELTSLETLSPNSHPAPLGLTAHVSTSSGSLQTRSQKAPSWGISCARATTRI
jgi:hypothetical protein